MKRYNSENKGFTLVEMIVVLAIFSVITGIVVANFPSMRNKVSIDLVSQNIALNIESAKTFGIAIRQIDGVTPRSWGVHFNQDVQDGFLLFYVPFGEDRKYQGSNFNCDINSSCEELYAIKGATIEGFCVVRGGNHNPCDNSYNLMDIVYTRPSSEPYFCLRNNYTDSCLSDNNVSYALINIKSSTDESERFIEVSANGQIAVKSQ